MPKERRTLTVLFSDLSGFTALSEHMDPEDVEEIVAALAARFRAAVEAEGGVVDKFIGDAVMAVFGAERAHEDDALRAVRAGLAMQREIAPFNAERGMDLSLRVGINTGEALWGEMPDGRRTAIGDAVNVAQRLEGAARPGKVLASRAVQRATLGRVRWRELPAMQVKGRKQWVQPYEADGLVERDEAYRGFGAEPAPLVGRKESLARLRELFETGRAAFVVLEGDAGIGKSRLAWEFHQWLVGRPDLVRERKGRCYDRVPLPLEPFAEMIQQRAKTGTADPEAWSKMARSLQEELAGVEDPVRRENLAHLMILSIGVDVPEARVKHIPPERMDAEMKDAWLAWAREQARETPLVLVVEDVHWAGDGTLALMEHLASRLREERVLVLATKRLEGRAPAGYGTVRLGPLGREECRGIARHALGREPAKALMEFAMEQTGGNPYYTQELCRYLVENDLLEADWVGAGIRVPDTLGGLLVGKIDRLEEAQRDAIKGASVIGLVFWLGVLGRALEREAAREVEELQRREMVFGREEAELPGELEYIFQHALLRDAAYSLLTKKDRARLHGLVAGALEVHGATRAKALAAGHWERAGDEERASRLWAEAAEEEVERGGYAAALEYATRGRASLARAKALVGLARYDEALAEAARADRRDEAGLVEAGIHDKRGAFAESLGAAGKVLAIEECAPVVRLEAMTARARALYRLARYDDAMAAAREAQDLAATILDEGTRPRRARASIPNVIGLVHWSRGEYDRALACHEESLVIRREIGDRYGAAASLNNIGVVHRVHGEYDRALACHEESLAIKREIGDRYGAAASLNNIGNVHYARGEYDHELACHEESLAITREIGDRYSAAMFLNNIGAVHLARGEYDRALACHEESLAIRREIGDVRGQSSALLSQGAVYGDLGRLAEAERAFEESITIARERGIAACLMEGLISRARMRARAADSRGAADAAEALDLARKANNPTATVQALSTLARFEKSPERLREARALVPPDGDFEAYLTVLEDEAVILGSAESAREGARLTAAKGARGFERRFPELLTAAGMLKNPPK